MKQPSSAAAFLCVAFALAGSDVSAADETRPAAGQRVAAPTTRPATTRPATTQRVVTKLTTKLADGTSVSALIDFNDAPDLKEWGIEAGHYALKHYPEIVRQLESENFQAPREFTIAFKEIDGVASASGGTITCSAKYVRKHPKDLGMIAHELVHVIQKYPRQKVRNTGWLTEGIADYIRYYVIEPGSKQAGFDPKRQSYQGGYQAAAGFMNWLEKTKGPGIVTKLNAALRSGAFTETTFKEIAGDEPDPLWEAFKASRAK